MTSNNGDGGATSSSTAAKSKIRLFGRKHKDAAPRRRWKGMMLKQNTLLQKEEGGTGRAAKGSNRRLRTHLRLLTLKKKLHLR
jgi:hypothetical protein